MNQYSFILEIFDRNTENMRARQVGREAKKSFGRVGRGTLVGAGAGALLGSKFGKFGAVAGGTLGALGGAVYGGARAIGKTAGTAFSSKRQLIDNEINNSKRILKAPRFLRRYNERDRALAQARLNQANRQNQNLAHYRQTVYASQNPEQRREINRRYRNESGNISAMYSADKQYGY